MYIYYIGTDIVLDPVKEIGGYVSSSIYNMFCEIYISATITHFRKQLTFTDSTNGDFLVCLVILLFW